jgi:hypothetical protein
VACITATSGAQRKYQDQSSRHRLTPAACIVLPDRSGWPENLVSTGPAPGDADSGPRTSLQRLEPPDTTEIYQASGQGFGEGQVRLPLSTRRRWKIYVRPDRTTRSTARALHEAGARRTAR